MQPPWPQVAPPIPPPIIPIALRTRRRLVRPRRGCFLQWPIYQAIQSAVALPDLSATEALSGRRTAAEECTARHTAEETALLRRAATETTTGRIRAVETPTGHTST